MDDRTLPEDGTRSRTVKVQVEETELQEVLLVYPEVYRDERGYFLEAFRRDVYQKAGLPSDFVQLNQSGSDRGVIRGLHFQWSPPMGKLMRVIRGRAFLVAADVRKDSPTLAKWVGLELKAEDRTHVWAPAGFARGFCALADDTEVEYLCTATYNGAGEGAVRWNDPEIEIEWPITDPVLSERDRNAPTLRDWLKSPEAGQLARGI